jgi:hypothetical protein
MSRPFVATLDVRGAGSQFEAELNIIAAYLRADVIELPIAYRQRGEEDSRSKLNRIRDGNFAMINWMTLSPCSCFS